MTVEASEPTPARTAEEPWTAIYERKNREIAALKRQIATQRADMMLEASRYAGEKGNRVIVPWTEIHGDSWRDGYRFAVNDIAQHFNMEYLAAKTTAERLANQL